MGDEALLNIEKLRVPALLVGRGGEILLVNQAFILLAAGRKVQRTVFEYCRHDLYRERDFCLDSVAGGLLELLVYGKPYAAAVSALGDASGQAYLLTLNNKEGARWSLGLQSAMLEYSVDCIKVIRADGRLEYMNRAGCVALGIPEGETQFGMRWLELLAPDVRSTGQQTLEAALGGASVSFPGRSAGPDGQVTHWNNLLSPIDDPQTGERKVICISRNVTEEIVAGLELKRLSETDDLTGVCNRRRFHRHLADYLLDERRGGAVLFLLDLDGFKGVNDNIGHSAGDALLQEVARRLCGCDEWIVGRMGGDEFALLCLIDGSSRDLASILGQVASVASRPFGIDGGLLTVGLSAGYVVLPREGAEGVDDALCMADAALRHVKSRGKNRVAGYHELV